MRFALLISLTLLTACSSLDKQRQTAMNFDIGDDKREVLAQMPPADDRRIHEGIDYYGWCEQSAFSPDNWLYLKFKENQLIGIDELKAFNHTPSCDRPTFKHNRKPDAVIEIQQP